MEPFSAAASGIRVVSLAIQIAESIQKCLRFWKSVRGALSDIERIVEDLEALDEILNSVMTYHQGLHSSETSFQPLPLPRALRNCANRLMDVVRTISDLEKGFQTRKLWTSVRATLREEAINKVRRDLESAKSSLILSNQLVLSQLQQAQYLNLLAQQKNIAVITQSVAQISIAVANPSVKRSSRRHVAKSSCPVQGYVEELPRDEDDESEIPTESGMIVSENRSLSTSNSSKKGGLLRRGFNLYSQNALRGGRVVPDDSPVFNFAYLGDVEQMWNLFDKGLASPLDTDSQGLTPLHLAAYHRRPFACNVLIDLGGDVDAVGINAKPPLASIFTSQYDLDTSSLDHMVDLTRRLVEYGGADIFIETDSGVPVYHSYIGPLDGLKILTNQYPFRESIADPNVKGWGVFHEQLYDAFYDDPYLTERLQFWIMQGADVNEATEQPVLLGANFQPKTTPLHAACYGNYDSRSDSWFLLLLKPGILELLLDAGADLHAMDGKEYTPLRLIAEWCCPEEYFRWFQMLWKLGVSLRGYVDVECSLYHDRPEVFDPKKMWNLAIRYGMGRRKSLSRQDGTPASASALFGEPLEEYCGMPRKKFMGIKKRKIRSEYEVDEESGEDSFEANFTDGFFSDAEISDAEDSEAALPEQTMQAAPETASCRSGQEPPTFDHQFLPVTDMQMSNGLQSNIPRTPQLKRKKAAGDLRYEETGR